VIRQAHGVADTVLSEGRELSKNLDQLATSLHRNAERLLQDIHVTHSRLVSTLAEEAPGDASQPTQQITKVTPPAAGEPPERNGKRREAAGPDFEIPDFVPRRTRSSRRRNTRESSEP
jgi:hypothetical protein